MHPSASSILKNALVVGALVLASLPGFAQRVSANSVKNGHSEALRGRLDAAPVKSSHWLSAMGIEPRAAASAAAAAERPSSHPPRPIVSPFYYPSSRSGSFNYGFLVGPNPFVGEGPSKASVRTFVVPVVIKVHQVATDFALDANGNIILSGIQNQDATYDPTQPSQACLGKKNNVPFTLALQSPVFENHHWAWGGMDLGYAQYNEAFQRANFWNANNHDPGRYGLHLDRQTLPPLVIDLPAGTAIGLPQSSALLGYSACAPTVLVDLNLFDAYLDYIALPQLAAYGVNSGNFTMFIAGNVLWGSVIGQLPGFVPEAGGYHSFSSVDPALTYGVTQFGDESFFTWPDAVPLSHEVSEWMNDPTDSNAVQAYNVDAAFDPTGTPTCQGNYETGDILAGFFMPPVVGKNGYTYTVQELAYFSYFYGGPSIAAGGAYSNNNTLTTDAGPACSPFQ